MRLLCLLFLALLAAPATAADLNYFTMLPTTPTASGVPSEAKAFYVEWRDGAARYTELLGANEEIQKKVGKPLDRQGALCVLWTKVSEFARETEVVLKARAVAQGRTPPSWTANAVAKTAERAKKECQDPTDDYGDRQPNLGRRYMEELAKSRHSRAELVRDDDLLGSLSRLVGAIEEVVKSLPARAGTALQAGSTSVPVLDPRLFLPKECKGVECSL
ncbi:hypothetical protein [Myxococcus sp. AB025B]|uniref:hypothetical protein n=1 Tax=Myxococcus sp. AB025B TaxID=2562794 RepID=UPI001142960E|nr:hypothetical protein [Myxococcus sp. AB025B]